MSMTSVSSIDLGEDSGPGPGVVARELALAARKVIHDQYVRPLTDGDDMAVRSGAGSALAVEVLAGGEVIDATEIYDGVAKHRQLWVGDQLVAPPFADFVVGFASSAVRRNLIPLRARRYDDGEVVAVGERWPVFMDSVEVVDWDRVRWLISGPLFIAEFGHDQPGVIGPVVWLDYAVYHDGALADARWVHTSSAPAFRPDDGDDPALTSMPFAMVAETLNFLNASNTYLDEPKWPRPVRRQLDRRGQRVTTIHVRPAGSKPETPGRPLGQLRQRGKGPVRGHFAEYGPKYGKGLLFGMYEGRFYISPHVRGSADAGEITHDTYQLHPN